MYLVRVGHAMNIAHTMTHTLIIPEQARLSDSA
jgi:hypothetical protein